MLSDVATLCYWPEQRATYAAHIKDYLYLKHKDGTLGTHTVNFGNMSLGNKQQVDGGQKVGRTSARCGLSFFPLRGTQRTNRKGDRCYWCSLNKSLFWHHKQEVAHANLEFLFLACELSSSLLILHSFFRFCGFLMLSLHPFRKGHLWTIFTSFYTFLTYMFLSPSTSW